MLRDISTILKCFQEPFNEYKIVVEEWWKGDGTNTQVVEIKKELSEICKHMENLFHMWALSELWTDTKIKKVVAQVHCYVEVSSLEILPSKCKILQWNVLVGT